VATASTDRLLQQLITESRDRFEMLDFLRRITLDVTNTLTLGVRIDDGHLPLSHSFDCFSLFDIYNYAAPAPINQRFKGTRSYKGQPETVINACAYTRNSIVVH